MSASSPTPPGWRLERHGSATELRLTGDWVARETGVRSPVEARHILDEAGEGALRVDAGSLGRWDSALIAFLQMLHAAAVAKPSQVLQIDEAGVPDAARRLLALASAGTTEATRAETPHRSLATRVGEAYFDAWSNLMAIATLVGESALRGTAAFAHRTRTRAVDVLLLIREAGPGALAIVAIVNALVGAIIAFVGAVELQRFG
ncbi:MAG TPA: hypothetical protein VJY33_06115, partial [Isosphaeraceae bacterium]|nr:hypothetical protein [Isosphaeraceae bacterium]